MRHVTIFNVILKNFSLLFPVPVCKIVLRTFLAILLNYMTKKKLFLSLFFSSDEFDYFSMKMKIKIFN